MKAVNRNVSIIAALTLIVLCIAYSNHFYNGFHFDDWHTIEENLFIRNIKNIPAFFSDPKMFSVDPPHYGLRPVVTTTLAIDYWLGDGLNPFYFHLSTFIWFIFLGLIIYFIYKNLLKQSLTHHWINYLAILATAWYMLNTANAETINYIISRSDVLSTTFIALSFLIFIAWPQKRKYYLYVIPALMGVFAKETVLVLVILLFFYILLFEKNLSIGELFKKQNFKQILNTIGSLLPLTIAVIALQVYTLSKVTAIDGISNPLLPYLLTQTYVWLHYFISFFLPVNLSADSDWTVFTNLLDERIIIGIAFIIAYVVTIIKTSNNKETKPIAFGLIWFGASLLPTSLAPFAEVTNDHRMFFPFIGLALSAVNTIGLFLIKHQTKIVKTFSYRAVILAITVTVLSLNAYGVYQRNKVWKSEETLWYDVTLKSPLNGRGHMNYGLAKMEIGDYETALSYFEKAQILSPYYSSVYINMGIAKNALNRPAEAEQDFIKAINLAPDKFGSYIHYARFLNKNYRLKEAIEMAEKAYQINSNSLLVLNELSVLYNASGNWEKLQKVSEQTLAILPNNKVALDYLKAAQTKTPYNESGSTEKPTEAYYINLSLDLYNKGNFAECIKACEEALKINPNSTAAYNNIGAANNKLGNWQKGVEACKKALEIDPNNSLAKGNLAWAKEELNKLKQ